METVQGGVPPYGVKETLVVNGKYNYIHVHFIAYFADAKLFAAAKINSASEIERYALV